MENISNENKLILGDCLLEMKNIPNETVSLVVTDPPYNISGPNKMTKKGNEFTVADFGEWDKFEKNEFIEWMVKVFAELYRVCKDGAAVYMFADKALISHIWDLGEAAGFKGKNVLVWKKSNPVPQFRKQNYLSATEFFVFFAKGVHKMNFLDQKEMHNMVEHPICSGHERSSHPTQKPLKVIEKYVFISSNEGDVVLDCFMGSGTTGVACVRLNRKFIGIEKDLTYFNIAKDRINNTQIIPNTIEG